MRLRFPRPGPLFLTALIVAICLGDAAQAGAQGFVPAQSARTFGDSIGVNVRLSWLDSPAYRDFGPIEARLRELGVRHVSDSICPGCTYQVDRLNRLAALGIKADIGVGTLAGGTASIAPDLRALRDKVPNAVSSIRPLNEPDIAGDPLWVLKTRAFQAELARQVNADPFLRRFPVLGPSLVNRDSRGQLGDLSSFLDRGNLHPYPGGRPPLYNLADEKALMSQVSKGKPLQITEIGYHTDMGFTGAHRPASERAVGYYMPRIALEAFRGGIPRTDIYQFADTWSPAQAAERSFPPSENSFGLLRWNLTPKPAFLSLRNLLRSVDSDSAQVLSPGGLRLGIEGAGSDVHQLLLRSADGSYALVLWRTVSVWDTAALRDLIPTPEHVEVALGQPIVSARRYDPVASPSPTQSWTKPQRIPLDLGGGPVVLRLVPPGTPAAGGGIKRALKVGARNVRCGGKLKARGSKRAQRRRARAGCCKALRHVHVRKAKRKHRRHSARKRVSASWSAQCSSVKHRRHK